MKLLNKFHCKINSFLFFDDFTSYINQFFKRYLTVWVLFIFDLMENLPFVDMKKSVHEIISTIIRFIN